MHSETPQVSHQKASQSTVTHDPVAASRRRLIQGGLAGAPLLMLLKTTPVLAQNCKNPSGFSVSGNLSRPKDFECTRSNGPGYWAAMGRQIPALPEGEIPVNPPWPFRQIGTSIGMSSYNGGSYNTMTLLQGLEAGDPFVRLIVAAYLNNAEYAFGFPATLSQVKSMWVEGPSIGFAPLATSNLRWGPSDIIVYLQYTMKD